MFGKCRKCDEPAIGNYYGGTPGLCQKHFEEERGFIMTKNRHQEEDSILVQARELASRQSITLIEAIAIVKK